MMLSYWVRCVQQLLYPAVPEVRESSDNSQNVMHDQKHDQMLKQSVPFGHQKLLIPNVMRFE